MDLNSPAVQDSTWKSLQGVITRIRQEQQETLHASIWCVTLVSAVLVLVARGGMRPNVR